MIIKKIISNTKNLINEWHTEDKKWFSSNLNNLDIQNSVNKLAFHNYCGWHFIEEYQNKNKEIISFVYEGGLEHNKNRNECMEKIDEFFDKIQLKTGGFNSEGFGSIFDRIINDYIKYLHLKENNDTRAELMEDQIYFLEKAAEQLYTDITCGQRQIKIFKKFKTRGY